MKIGSISLAVLLATSSGSFGSIITYEYTGGVLDSIYTYGGQSSESMDWLLGKRHSAVLVLDEAALGQSLKNAEISFHFFPYIADTLGTGPIEGIRGFDYGFVDAALPAGPISTPTRIRRPTVEADLQIWTDEFGNITRGCYFYLDGPPDGAFGCGGDEIYDGGMSVYGQSGTWSKVSGEIGAAVIPLPATVWMGLLGLSSLPVINWFRRARSKKVVA
jgi:hypothetical protein